MAHATAWPVRAAGRERNRSALVTAAAALFAEHGYAGCSLAAVAARCGLSTGAVYSIFGSKAELFLAVLYGQARLPDFESPEAGAAGWAGELGSFARRWAAQVNSAQARALLELSFELQLAALRDPALLDAVRELQRRDRERLGEELAAAALRHGVPQPVPAAVRALVTALQALAAESVLYGEPADPEAFAELADRLLGDTGA